MAAERIRRLYARGGTNLSGGWFSRVDCAAAVAETDPVLTPRAIILSDGQANEGIADIASLAEHAQQLRLRGIITSTLGIGDNDDEQLLQAVSENRGGRHHDAELAIEIERVLLGEVDEVIQAAVEAVTLHLDLPRDVRAEILGFGATVGTGEERVSALVGALEAGRPRLVVARLFCPAGHADDALAFHLRASGRSSASGAAVNAGPIEAQLVFADGAANTAQPRDAQCAVAVMRAWHSHLIRQVADLNRTGEFEAAEHRLQRELRHFEPYTRDLPGGPELIGELRLMLERVGQRWSARTHKEIALAVNRHGNLPPYRRRILTPGWGIDPTVAERWCGAAAVGSMVDTVRRGS